MVLFYPSTQPRLFSEQNRGAEQDVWRALTALDARAPADHRWHVFYSVTEEDDQGFDREVDYVLVWRNRIIYIEVKGGYVLVDRPARGTSRWTRMTQGGKKLEPVQPAQLWNAKKAIRRMIMRELGAHPKQLGFVEYEFHVFPHTPRAHNGGKTFNRGAVRYVFKEDLQGLATQLETLVRSRGNKFADWSNIERLISCLRLLAYQPDAEDSGAAPGTISTQSTQARIFTPVHPTEAQRMNRASQVMLPKSQPPRRFDLTWKGVFPWLCGVGVFLLLLLLLSVFEPAKQPVARHASPVKPPSATVQPRLPSPQAKPVQVPATIQKSVPESGEADLPIFVPAGAVAEIERIFETARIPDMSLRWSAGNQYGYVTLQKDEGNGCRRWRISRNDEAPVFDFVRRCQ